MPSRDARAARCRAQAADMCDLAAKTKNPNVKTEYLRLAREYEKLAAEIEKAGKTGGSAL